MKFAVCTVTYNEAEYIGACVDNWSGLIDKHLVLVSSKPWNGSPVEDDNTAGIARKHGAEVIIGEWKTEAEQRSWGLARLYDYDYVLIIDADELFTKEDQAIIMEYLNKPIDISYRPDQYIPAFRCKKMKTYWKTHEYTFDPPDNHQPIIAVDPKRVYGFEHRNFKFMNDIRDYIQYSPEIPVTCHHMSWAKSDDKVREKIQSFSHADAIKPNWYKDVWGAWVPDSKMCIRAYGSEPSVAKYGPAPQEIIDLISNSLKKT
jgi:glycosyltransferase involved in cell wall biosynthesis